MPKKDRHRIAAAVPPVTRQPVGTGAVDAAGCRHTSPLDVAPERALPGSCDRLCPDGDHRRKAAEMKSSDPVDYRNPPRLPKSATAHPGMANGSPDGEWVTSTRGLQGFGNSCKVVLMFPLRRELILQILAAPIDYDKTERIDRIAALILNEIRTRDAYSMRYGLAMLSLDTSRCRWTKPYEPQMQGYYTSRADPRHSKRGRKSPAPAIAHWRGFCERDGDALCRLAASSLARRRVGAVGARARCRLGATQSRLCERQRFLLSNVSRDARQRPRAINSLIQPLEP